MRKINDDLFPMRLGNAFSSLEAELVGCNREEAKEKIKEFKYNWITMANCVLDDMIPSETKEEG